MRHDSGGGQCNPIALARCDWVILTCFPYFQVYRNGVAETQAQIAAKPYFQYNL
jgi:hypothetical protein